MIRDRGRVEAQESLHAATVCFTQYYLLGMVKKQQLGRLQSRFCRQIGTAKGISRLWSKV